ncbi:MAG: response regulator [Gammaproteobacteria bacterium]|nr:response regulator [Gammaproteobacteria bacterium]
MDGLELCERIRKSKGDLYTYFILVTVQHGDQKYLDAMDRGVDDFLVKPIDFQQLAMRLRVAERILSYNAKIQYLEDLVTICAYTKKVKLPGGNWQSIEDFLNNIVGIRLTHGIEPEYYKNLLMPQVEKLRERLMQDSFSNNIY